MMLAAFAERFRALLFVLVPAIIIVCFVMKRRSGFQSKLRRLDRFVDQLSDEYHLSRTDPFSSSVVEPMIREMDMLDRLEKKIRDIEQTLDPTSSANEAASKSELSKQDRLKSLETRVSKLIEELESA